MINFGEMVKFARLIAVSLVIFLLPVFPLACKMGDVANYKADDIALLARNTSPDCPAVAEG